MGKCDKDNGEKSTTSRSPGKLPSWENGSKSDQTGGKKCIPKTVHFTHKVHWTWIKEYKVCLNIVLSSIGCMVKILEFQRLSRSTLFQSYTLKTRHCMEYLYRSKMREHKISQNLWFFFKRIPHKCCSFQDAELGPITVATLVWTDDRKHCSLISWIEYQQFIVLEREN